jgi:hypothetical protein
MAPSAVNEARRELAQLRSMIDEARRELGIETPKPAPIAAERSRRWRGSRKAARAAKKTSAA